MSGIFQTIPGFISRPRRVSDRSRNPLWRLRRVFFGMFVLGVLSFFALFAFYIQTDLPDISDEQALASHICLEAESTCDSKSALASASQADSDRDPIDSIEEVPDVVIHALVAAEDKDFFEHRGINTLGIARGVIQTAKAKITGSGSAQGGSSITQQLVKNQYIDSTASFNADQLGAIARKPEEVVLSLRLERKLASEDIECGANDSTTLCVKNEILRRYFNTVYYGRGVNGLKSAARVYFDKDLAEINLEEAAYLAGVLRNPTRAEPVNNPDEARRRIVATLKQMFDQGYITDAERSQALDRMNQNFASNPELLVPLPNFVERVSKEGLGQVEYASVGSEYFVDEVWQQVDEVYPGTRFTGGLKVYTTMDPAMQTAAYESLTSTITPGNPDMPDTALVSIDSQGMVRALVGGYDYENQAFNFATARGSAGRQPGSLMKPIGLASAIEQGFSAKSLYTAPTTISFPVNYKASGLSDEWNVKGGMFDDATYPNYTTLEQATWGSVNSVYAQMVFDIKPENLVETAQALGVESEFGTPLASHILGTNSASVVDMASAYSTFERGGVQLAPRVIQRIEDRNGNVICWYPANGVCLDDGPVAPDITGERAISSDTARQVNQILSGVVSSGTGTRAQIPGAEAGKTGTSQSNRDAWFTGYTCDLTTSIWVGFDDNRAMENMGGLFPGIVGRSGTVTGGSVPAHMWGNYMERATASAPACNSLDVSSSFTGTVLNDDYDTGLAACGVITSGEADLPGGTEGGEPIDPAAPIITVPIPDPNDQDDAEAGDEDADDEQDAPTTTGPIVEDDDLIEVTPDEELENLLEDLGGVVQPAALAFQANPDNRANNQAPGNNQPGAESTEPNSVECMVPGDNVAKAWVLFGDPGALQNPLAPVIEPGSPSTTVDDGSATTTTVESTETSETTEVTTPSTSISRPTITIPPPTVEQTTTVEPQDDEDEDPPVIPQVR